jgi:hypothetical protein
MIKSIDIRTEPFENIRAKTPCSLAIHSVYMTLEIAAMYAYPPIPAVKRKRNPRALVGGNDDLEN